MGDTLYDTLGPIVNSDLFANATLFTLIQFCKTSIRVLVGFLCLSCVCTARYTVVCFCVCVCVDYYGRSNKLSASKSFYRLLVIFSWIAICGLLRSRVIARFAYLECHCSFFRTVHSKTCPWSVATVLSSWFCTRTL